MAVNHNRQLLINLISSIFAFLVNAGIQFFITPILTQYVGDEAYGFIAIANDFTSYANIFAAILNSVAARFISIEIHKRNYDSAEKYYSSVMVGNIIISCILLVLSILVVFQYDKLLNVPDELIFDVRVVFIITFCGYILNILISIFTVATFVKDRLDLAAIRNIGSYIVKIIGIQLLFTYTSKIKIYYVSLANLASIAFLGVSSIGIAKRIMPEIRFHFKKFDMQMVWNLMKSGIWMSINNMALVMANSFTTLLINIFINPTSAGIYSVARLLPNSASSLMYAVYNIFCPTYVRLYAENKITELKDYSIKSMKLMSLLLSIPFVVLIVLGKDFLILWQYFRNDEEIRIMYIILVLSMLLLILNIPVLSISQLGMTVNKMNWQMINNLFISGATLVGIFVIVSKTRFELIGVVTVMLVIQGGKWLFFTPIYAAYVLKIHLFTFFVESIKLLIKTFFVAFALFLVGGHLHIDSWTKLILCGSTLTILGYGIYFCILFNKIEREAIISKIKYGLK